MIDESNITGIVLTGGKSSRMGTDKGFLKLNNKHFTTHSINALKPLVSEILIISDNPDYDAFHCKRIEDEIKNAGPVAGIYSGLNVSKTKYNLVLSCDIPFINTAVLQQLIDAVDATSDVIQIESNGKTMPLIAMYKTETLEMFKTALNNNERRLQNVLKSLKTKSVILNKAEENTTINVNTPNDFKAIANGNNY
ncbi:hypothetical protein PK35_03940 [Tamlana nanhaiensis]|uniref:Probable molybdenum cofactor guanylyltransferase n=1 Tax=Neotamlana nanhaiensis TaxID=1382798 RepID=A0A0D7W451_9FLAO|nr:molybdenum cofactor guanylyltransferase [Tamlana nanhaiensis]KJD33900.1 hypothetical protein PK35_03940 [Tamlana nanhaiensis]